MILNDRQIAYMAKESKLISPFCDKKVVGKTGISVGLSSFGYDASLGNEWADSTGSSKTIKVGNPPEYYKRTQPAFRLRPGGFVLAHTEEYFKLPATVTGLVKDKSTYARLGIAVQNTVLEAGWEGQITLEISNHGPFVIELRAGEGIVQVIFITGEVCRETYVGKYQRQKGVFY